MKTLLLFVCLFHIALYSLSQGTVTIGNGTGVNSATGYPAPYGAYYGSSKHQFIILASELRNAGLQKSSLTSLAFNVAPNSAITLVDFTIKLKSSMDSVATLAFAGGMTTVFGPVNAIIQPGWMTHQFTIPFYWDGISNLIVETCFNNNTPTANAQTYYTTTSFNSVAYKYADLGSQCAQTAAAYSSVNRPNMKIGYVPPGQVGGGTTTNTNTTYPAPYGNYYWGAKHQMLFRATELAATGMKAGPISSLAFNVAGVQGTPLVNFTIRMKQTNVTTLSGTFDNAGFQDVWGPSDYAEKSGWNEHVFTQPFEWDGTSNILVETCFNNSSYTNNARTYYTTGSFTNTIYYDSDNSGVCSITSGTISSSRPNIRFTQEVNDAGVTKLIMPGQIGCPDPVQPVLLEIKNYSSSAKTDIPVTAVISGGASFVFNDTIPGPVAAGQTDTILINNFSTQAGQLYFIQAYTNLSGDANGNNDTAFTTLQVQEMPNAGFNAQPSGLTVNFTADYTGGSQYNWDFGDSDVASGAAVTHTFPAAGTYTVTLNVQNLCGSDEQAQSISVDPTGIGSQTGEFARVYPTLSDGHFSIDYEGPASELEIEVTGMLGQLLMKEQVPVQGTLHKEFTLNKKGICLVQISGKNELTIKQLIIQ